MRGVWGRISRPKLSSVRLPRHRANPASRGDAALSGFQMRPATFNDAFGIFLAPFLAAATIVNLSWKEKQKKDWDNKLAEIDKEIEVLRAREQRLLSRLQHSAATRLGNRRERRNYSTAAVAPSNQSSVVVSGSPYDPEPEPSSIGDFSKSVQAALQHHPPPFALPTSPDGLADRAAIDDVPETVWEVERLIATRLALELVVMAHLGGSPTAVTMGSNLPPPPEAKAPHTANLLEQLQRVKHLESAAMRKSWRHSGFIPDHMDDTSGHFMSLLHHLTGSYKNGNLTYVQLLENICEALVNSRAPPTIRHYTSLVKFLHDHHFSPYAPLVISALSRSKLMLDEIACERVLEHIGHTRDVKAFDWWLAEFTKVNSRLVSTQRWEWHRLSGQRLPLPSSQDPRLIKTLTFTALQLEQFPRAEAWSSVMIHDNYRGETWADLIKAFLLYYTKQGDWTKGRVWIREVVDTPTLADKGAFRAFKDFGTLIYRMLALCVECGKRSQYAEILRAAVAANVKPPDIDTRRIGTPGERKPGSPGERNLLAILSEWSWMIDTGPSGRNLTDEMRVAKFQEGLRSSEMYNELQSLGDGRSQSDGSLSVRQQATLDKLTAQLSQSKQKLEQQLEEARKLQESLQVMLNEQVNRRGDSDSQPQRNVQMPEDKRWEEQQSALALLQEELSRHREIINSEMKERRQQQHQLRSQPSHFEEMQDGQQLPPSIHEPATDSQIEGNPLSPVYGSDHNTKDRPMADSDSDSGYSSDSSRSSHVEEGVNHATSNRHPLTKGFAGMDEKGRFLGAKKFWDDALSVGLGETPNSLVYRGVGGCHRVDVDSNPGPDDESREGDPLSAERSVEATSEFFNHLDAMYPPEPPTVASPAPEVIAKTSEVTVPAATSAMPGSAAGPLLTTKKEQRRPADRRSARRLILDNDAELAELEASRPPRQGPGQKVTGPSPVAGPSKEDESVNIIRIRRQHSNDDQLQDRTKPPTFRIRKQKGFGGVDSLKRERRLQVASFHAQQKIQD